jgi:hypothetical protein
LTKEKYKKINQIINNPLQNNNLPMIVQNSFSRENFNKKNFDNMKPEKYAYT